MGQFGRILSLSAPSGILIAILTSDFSACKIPESCEDNSYWDLSWEVDGIDSTELRFSSVSSQFGLQESVNLNFVDWKRVYRIEKGVDTIGRKPNLDLKTPNTNKLEYKQSFRGAVSFNERPDITNHEFLYSCSRGIGIKARVKKTS